MPHCQTIYNIVQNCCGFPSSFISLGLSQHHRLGHNRPSSEVYSINKNSWNEVIAENVYKTMKLEMLKINGVDDVRYIWGKIDINISLGYWKTKKQYEQLITLLNAPYLQPLPVWNDPQGVFPPKPLWATYLRQYVGCFMTLISLREGDVNNMGSYVTCSKGMRSM